MQATAYAPTAKPTADGTAAHEGVAAADPAVLPLNSRIRVTGAGPYSGVYDVRDTGDKVVGRRIDLCVPTTTAARRFGKKAVTVRVLKIGDNKLITALPGPVVK
jgi:3D (Asp-Asp-Asp) domain-containing protein